MATASAASFLQPFTGTFLALPYNSHIIDWGEPGYVLESTVSFTPKSPRYFALMAPVKRRKRGEKILVLLILLRLQFSSEGTQKRSVATFSLENKERMHELASRKSPCFFFHRATPCGFLCLIVFTTRVVMESRHYTKKTKRFFPVLLQLSLNIVHNFQTENLRETEV